MFAEAMAGIALVKASVEFIKSNIDTAKDIGEIAGAVDNLFKGQEEIEKKRSTKAGVGGVADQLHGAKHFYCFGRSHFGVLHWVRPCFTPPNV